MAHPTRSNTRIGLPSNPSPRSRSLSARPSRQDIPPRPASSASNAGSSSRTDLPPLPHTLRSQRSLNDLSTPSVRRIARIPPPPLPTLNRLPVPVTALETRKSEESISSLTSGTSSSHSSLASSSSLFSSSPASSSTSVSDYADEVDVPKQPKEEERGRPYPEEGFGVSLWNRVAAAAGNLTVSVSKAIEANVMTYAGEATPPGQESRLTKAMKNYYIAKAREPADLPEWLFEERDRGTLGRLRIANATPEDDLRKSVVLRTPSIALPPPVPPLPPVESMPAPIIMSDTSSIRSRASSVRRSQSRVRFAEQVHPRQQRGDVAQLPGSATYPPPPVPAVPQRYAMVRTAAVPPIPRGTTRLPDVNLHGRRPSAQGLPSGVRPTRPRVVV